MSTDNAAPSQTGSVTLEFELQHPPEKVWRALTDPVLLAEWLLPVVDFKLLPGAAFSFTAPPQPGWDGTVKCRFTAIETHRKLSYTWVVDDERRIETVVTFTLNPTEKGTRLSLAHTGFKLPDQKAALGGTRYGWKMMGAKLVELLARI